MAFDDGATLDQRAVGNDRSLRLSLAFGELWGNDEVRGICIAYQLFDDTPRSRTQSARKEDGKEPPP
mgnify:CR=1 FL=1